MPNFSMTKQKFINQWLRHFASNVSKQDIEKYVKDQYIWHVFSYNLVKYNFLEGNDARAAYDMIDKSNCIFCDMFGANGVTDRPLAEYFFSKDIDDKIAELYVVASDFSWTYIKTHDNGLCGPYFIKMK